MALQKGSETLTGGSFHDPLGSTETVIRIMEDLTRAKSDRGPRFHDRFFVDSNLFLVGLPAVRNTGRHVENLADRRLPRTGKIPHPAIVMRKRPIELKFAALDKRQNSHGRD